MLANITDFTNFGLFVVDDVPVLHPGWDWSSVNMVWNNRILSISMLGAANMASAAA